MLYLLARAFHGNRIAIATKTRFYPFFNFIEILVQLQKKLGTTEMWSPKENGANLIDDKEIK